MEEITGTRAAADLKAGDTFSTHGTTVTVLHDAKPSTETVMPLAGQPCIWVWARRNDTGKEGSMTFGLSAGVFLAQAQS
jgi:hypothetical protein